MSSLLRLFLAKGPDKECDLDEYFKVVMKPQTENFTLFIDDTLRNFGRRNPKVMGLLPPSSPNSQKTPDEIPEDLGRTARKTWYSKDIGSSYDAKSGIPTEGFKCLELFVRVNKGRINGVVLDWDKTLTKHSSFKCESITAPVAQCYFGGKARMKAIKSFFTTLKKLEIPIMILTNNARAKRESEPFQRALRYVGAYNVNISFAEGSKMDIVGQHWYD